MKIITLIVDDELYDQIYNISKQTSTSLNKTTKEKRQGKNPPPVSKDSFYFFL